MFDEKELRRLARLHRLARQIAASLPAEIYSTHALRVDERTDQLLKWQHDGSLQPESASGASRLRAREVCCSGIRALLARRSPELGALEPHRRFPPLSPPSSERWQS